VPSKTLWTRPRIAARMFDSFQARTVGLVLAVLLPAFILAAGLLWSMELQARHVLNDQLSKTARALSLVVDRELGERGATIDSLATSSYLKQGDFKRFDAQAREALANSKSWIVVHDENYAQLVNTRIARGAKLPAANRGTPYLAGERGNGQQITNLMVGAVTQKAVTGISRSVRLNDGRIVGIAIITFAADFDEIFNDQKLPSKWTGAILDANNKVVARSRASDKYRGTAATTDLDHALKGESESVLRSRTLDGVNVTLAFRRLPGYNWTVLVALPLSETSLVGGSAVAWSAGLAIALLGLSVLLAIYVAGRIEAPVRRLAIAASDWRNGKRFSQSFDQGPMEVRALAAAFHETLDALDAANQQLSSQVSETTAAFERIWQLSRDGFVIADKNGVWLRASPAWSDLLGWQDADLIGRTSTWLAHKDDTQDFDALTSSRAKARFTSRLRAKSGEYRWFSWTVVSDGDLRYYTARDITHEKAAAAELERTQAALRQSQKMDAIGQLTGGVAHDFNNLLTPIVGALDIVRRRAQLSERDGNLLNGAAEAAERARVLVQRLLAFARRQPLQAQSVDVGALVEGAATLISSVTGSRIQLKIDIGENLPAALADPNELEMALLNLAANARDAMPDGGILRVSVDSRMPDPDQVKGMSPGPYVVVSVSDTGAGMDEETIARAAEPFFSTKGVGKGTGLGLSMVYGLTEQLGGAVNIQSQIGAGTCVEVWLPSTTAKTNIKPIARDQPPFTATGIVLLVDDEALVRATVGDMLASLGFTVIEAGDANEALTLLEDGLQPRFIVTDHLMPGLTGAQLAQTVRQKYPEIRVLLVTGYAEQKDLPDTLPRLRKPFVQSELAAEISKL
jgi:PAS domain S-box-containing protein